MGYLPFARKYRPQTFDDLIGQPHVAKTLKSALETKRIAQAYLFAGMRGVGKTSAARILAKCLNCSKGPQATPCDKCASCMQIIQGNSLDVIEIDGASNRGIDEIRNLRESVPYSPTIGSFRVYIIDEVHMLTTEAFNALLKTLEEPPRHVKFIFATTAAHKVPSTILSRCQRFDFRRLEPSTIVRVLEELSKLEGISADESALYSIARAAEGSLRDGEVILEQMQSFVKGKIRESDVTELLGIVASEAVSALLQAVLERDCARALSLLSGQIEQGRDALQILIGLLHRVRNLLILSSTKGTPSQEPIARLIDEPPERLTVLRAQAGESSTGELLVFLQILTSAYELLRRSQMAQTILELVLIKLCTREEWQSLDTISRRLEQLAQSAASGDFAKASPAAKPQDVTPPREGEPQAEQPIIAQELAGDVEKIWPAFLEKLGKQKMSLAAYLMEARPIKRSGSVLNVGLPGFSLHHEVLGHAENKKIIERILSELLGTSLRIEFTVLSDSSKGAYATSQSGAAAPPNSPAIVQDIVQLFNATLLDQPRNST